MYLRTGSSVFARLEMSWVGLQDFLASYVVGSEVKGGYERFLYMVPSAASCVVLKIVSFRCESAYAVCSTG